MKEILSADGLLVLEQYACSNVLLAFDYDGTLSPIVANRELAVMRKRTSEELSLLAGLYPIVVISGRTKADVGRRVKGSGVRVVVGNHGIEPWQATDAVSDAVKRWQPRLRAALHGVQGVQIEDKRFSVAVHYRQSREKKRARASILDAVSSLGAVRVIGGKQVVNILPPDAPHKGLALERERDRHGCDTAIYVGDDETDEDVFALDQPGRILKIRVGLKRDSMADYGLRSQRDVDELLRRLRTHRRSNREVGEGRA